MERFPIRDLISIMEDPDSEGNLPLETPMSLVWPKTLFKGFFYRIDEFSDGTYGGHVNGLLFSGLKSEREAMLWVIEKLDQR